jgi:hypothetical protein
MFLKYKTFIFIFLSLVVGWYLHSYYYSHNEEQVDDIVQIRENSSANRFINPLILVTDNRKIEFKEYEKLKDEVKDYINKSKNNSIPDISFYFRDLDSSEWIEINENLTYAPSSMLKVATLIAYSKLADGDPKILLEEVWYEPKKNFYYQGYKSNQLKPDYYIIRELLQQMIVESDNDALISLNNLHVEEVLKIYKDLNLPSPPSEGRDFLSPKYYSRLFRVLYDGSYVSRFYSNEALELLTYTKFDKGIVDGIGSTTITVAHKFGEFTNFSGEEIDKRELHDCGIVYYPKKPYFICIMTKAKDADFVDLEKIIADISKITFDYVDNRK